MTLYAVQSAKQRERKQGQYKLTRYLKDAIAHARYYASLRKQRMYVTIVRMAQPK